MSVVEVMRGRSPVILSFPHTSTETPDAIWDRLNDDGRLLGDTDWHLQNLYDELLPDVTTVRATFSRYVIDANRDPAGASLYPGQRTTGLIPTTDFGGKPIWREGQEPTEGDVAERLAGFHAPYHAALAAEIERVKTIRGVAVLYDCHSIRPRLPYLFPGRLPDFNIGTDDGRTCAPEIEAAAVKIAGAASGFTSVLNGRFKGGWTTRHYGQPTRGSHAIQMELSQSTYLPDEEPPRAYDGDRLEAVRLYLASILETIEWIALHLKRGTAS